MFPSLAENGRGKAADADKIDNMKAMGTCLANLWAEKADFVVLPEMFCCHYQIPNFPAYAEEEGGPVWQELSLDYEKQVREELSLLKSRRHDVYRLERLCEQDK